MLSQRVTYLNFSCSTQAAPKIGVSNIGYKMLATMGWAEGDGIGLSGGLDAPLKAIIKNTKLGLGASRS